MPDTLTCLLGKNTGRCWGWGLGGRLRLDADGRLRNMEAGTVGIRQTYIPGTVKATGPAAEPLSWDKDRLRVKTGMGNGGGDALIMIPYLPYLLRTQTLRTLMAPLSLPCRCRPAVSILAPSFSSAHRTVVSHIFSRPFTSQIQ